METSPIFLPKLLSPEASVKLDKIRLSATVLLEAIESITPDNENARMIAISRTKLEECVLWTAKALSREPAVPPTLLPGDDDV